MKLKSQNVLFFTRTMKLGGTENVVLQLCEIFKPLVNKIVVCSCGGVNVEKLTAMGIKHYQIDDIVEKSPLKILSVCKTLKRIISAENITVIHTHHRMAAFYVAMLGLYKKIHFINTSHNTFLDKKQLTRFAYNNCNIVACGEMVKENLVRFYELPEKQVTVIHNAVKAFNEPIIQDDLVKELHQNGFFVVANVGRLSKQKGMEYFIKAIPSIIEKHKNARFVIAGAGEDERVLKNLARELKLDNYLYFLGYRNDIQNLISQVDLVVLSSLWEGLPLTPIEAFSVGKTMVATAVDGTVEIINDGEDGYLVPPKDFSAIAEKVSFLISNPYTKKEFEENAQQTYLTKFSFSRFAKKYIDFYEEI